MCLAFQGFWCWSNLQKEDNFDKCILQCQLLQAGGNQWMAQGLHQCSVSKFIADLFYFCTTTRAGTQFCSNWKFCLLWVNPAGRKTPQSSSSLPPQWDGGEKWGEKVKLVAWDKHSLIGQKRKGKKTWWNKRNQSQSEEHLNCNPVVFPINLFL